MRSNQPVTSKEYKLRQNDYLISRTDLKGRITFANRAFIKVSGFTKEELIGAPHNIVRHPDMPAEVFKDLWQTLRLGQAWRGLVKNRRKNGDYYWVSATVTPTVKDGRLVGYTSVRAMAAADQVLRAEIAYAKLRKGHSGLVVENGAVVRGGLVAKIGRKARLDLKSLVAASQVVSIASFLLTLLLFESRSDNLGGLRPWTWGAFFVALTCVAYSGMSLRSQVFKPMADILDIVLGMGAGDLTARSVRVSEGEMGSLADALQTTRRSLLSVIEDMQDGMTSISDATDQMIAGQRDLASRSAEQATALEAAARSTRELTQAVLQNTENARLATNLADHASAVAESGGQAVGRVVQTMEEISSASRRIVDIIDLIETIAFQTNILALNAAVEAARAGSDGKGFAVVAGEVRNLSQRTAEAAKEIRALIGESADRVNVGAATVADARETMAEIMIAVKRVSNIVAEISVVSKAQKSGIHQVDQAISWIEEMKERNGQLVDSAAETAARLDSQSERLRDTVVTFQID